jgi:hypothetical protein
MFYLLEIFTRVKYSIFSFFFTFLLFYIFKDVLLVLVVYTLFSLQEDLFISFNVDHFIYTHPTELFSMYITLIFICSLFFFLPYMFWHIFDFLKQSLYLKEKNVLSKFLISFILILFFFNFIFFFFIFPQIWLIFNSFNNSVYLDLLFELKINEYLYFFFYFLFVFNFFFFTLFLFLLVLLFLGLVNVIRWKKLFIFCNIVFATLLSPPDVYSQILFLSILTIFFELFLFFIILIFKNQN